MTFDQVRALTIRSDAYAGDYSCEKVPTLEEILRTCKGRVVVLIDANKTARVDLLVKAVVDTDTTDWAVFDTGDVNKIDEALAIEPRLRIMNRPSNVAAITTELDHFARQTPPRLPVIVELQASDRREGSKAVHLRGTRAFSDIFVEDAAASIQGNLTLYGKAFDDGLDIVQTERPELVLQFLRQRGLR